GRGRRTSTSCSVLAVAMALRPATWRCRSARPRRLGSRAGPTRKSCWRSPSAGGRGAGGRRGCCGITTLTSNAPPRRRRSKWLRAGPGWPEGPRPAPRHGRATALVVLLHGYGANGDDLIALAEGWQARLPAAAFVAPNAPETIPGMPGALQWFALTFRDP